MSIFKKSVTCALLLTFLSQSVGTAVAATIKHGNKPVLVAQSNNPLAAMLNPMGSMGVYQAVDSDGGINIPLSTNGQIKDPELMRTMLTELSEMAASAPVEMAPQGHPLTTPALQERMTGGDARVRSNDVGAIISDVRADTQSEKAFDMTESAPMLWARYYPYSRVGYIQMITLRKKSYAPQFDVSAKINSTDPSIRANAIGDAMELQTEVLGPLDGMRLVKGNGIRQPYRGVNPFSAFVAPVGTDPKLYSQISFAAFLTTVGVWGRYYSTQRGFVAVAENRQEKKEWKECIKKIFGACLRRRNHVESYVELRPRWYLMTSAENGIGKSNVMAYSSDDCKAKPSKIPPGSQFDPARETECVVFSGAAFLEATNNADIPNEWLKVWHQHQAVEGWTMLFFFILIAIGGFAFSALIGPVFAGTMNVAVGAAMAGLDVVLTIAVLDGILIAGAYALTSFVLNGGGNITDIQNGLFGSLGPGIEIPAGGGDPNWSPHACVVTGTRPPYLYGDAPARSRHNKPEPGAVASQLPPSGCIHWLKNDLETAPGPVGDFYRARRPNAVRDYTVPNDIENMNIAPPRRFDGAPVRN